jgi:hypothetical protein
VIDFGRRFETAHFVGRDQLFEVFSQTGVCELRRGYLRRRIRQYSQPKTGLPQFSETLGGIGKGSQRAQFAQNQVLLFA